MRKELFVGGMYKEKMWTGKMNTLSHNCYVVGLSVISVQTGKKYKQKKAEQLLVK